MQFKVRHATEYIYSEPASESIAELRVCPQDSPTQRVLSRELKIQPEADVGHYSDYFGNLVEFVGIPYRHSRLKIESTAEVETFPAPDISASLEISVAESKQIFTSQRINLFEFMLPTGQVPLYQVLQPLGQAFLRPHQKLGVALFEINNWIFKNLKYKPGVTTTTTPLDRIIQSRKGVCQDFAHLMLSILRTNGIPARYVSGYIEAFDPEMSDSKLIGAAASHAWIEAYLPGGYWLGLDPTNNQVQGERHVKVASGRDYDDVAPMRGTYKGAKNQELKVIVALERKNTSTSNSEGMETACVRT